MTQYVTNDDKPHLGGNIREGDSWTWCPSAWEYILKKHDIENMTDVGSGMGHAAKWFSDHGIATMAIDGLEENVRDAIFPTMLHDITQGPFIRPTDLVCCIEVVEHIEERYLENLLTTICQGELLLMTHAVPGQPGWHHVNCQPSEYWIDHLDRMGYILSTTQTAVIQELALRDGGHHIARNGMLFMRK